MLFKRIIPTLLLKGESLVKTVNFNRRTLSYVGDPCNTVRIFNELEVDELIFLDITCTEENRKPGLKLLENIANECFMPLAYGGGIKSIEDAKTIFDIGFEKIILNNAAFSDSGIIEKISSIYGSQATVVSMDIKNSIFGKKLVYLLGGKKNTKLTPSQWAKECENRGCGEIFLTSIDKEGTWTGFDLHLINEVVESVNIPVVVHGGAGSVKDIETVFSKTNASAVGVGSLVVFQKKDMGILINYPNPEIVRTIT